MTLWTHHQRGGEYRELCRATLQGVPVTEDDIIVILQVQDTWIAVREWEALPAGGTVHYRALLQSSAGGVVPGATLIVYQSAQADLWTREEDEFLDGRFLRVTGE